METKATALHELNILVDPEMTEFGNFKGTVRDIAAMETVQINAWKNGRHPSSNGQLMKTLGS